MAKSVKAARVHYTVIYRPWVTLKSGRRIYAASYGLKAFAIRVRADR